MNQTWYGVTPVYVECKTERIFAIACVEKEFDDSYVNFRLIRIINFK